MTAMDWVGLWAMLEVAGIVLGGIVLGVLSAWLGWVLVDLWRSRR